MYILYLSMGFPKYSTIFTKAKDIKTELHLGPVTTRLAQAT